MYGRSAVAGNGLPEFLPSLTSPFATDLNNNISAQQRSARALAPKIASRHEYAQILDMQIAEADARKKADRRLFLEDVGPTRPNAPAYPQFDVGQRVGLAAKRLTPVTVVSPFVRESAAIPVVVPSGADRRPVVRYKLRTFDMSTLNRELDALTYRVQDSIKRGEIMRDSVIASITSYQVTLSKAGNKAISGSVGVSSLRANNAGARDLDSASDRELPNESEFYTRPITATK